MVTTDATRAAEAERVLVGAAFLRQDVLSEIGDLPGEAFAPSLAVVLGAMRAVAESGTCVDLVTVSQWLEAHGRLDRAGGFSALVDLASAVPSAANARYYADLVRKAWQRRRAAAALQIALNRVRDGASSRDEAAAAASDALRILADVRQERCKSLRVLLADRIAAYEAIQDGESQPPIRSCGFPALDRVAMPWEPGDLVVLSADGTGRGKTSLAWQMALSVALQGRAVLWCSAEMSAAAMADRFFVQEAGLDLWRARRGQLREVDWRAVVDVAGAEHAARIWVDDGVRTTWDAIARAQRLSIDHGQLGMVVVDHLHQLTDRRRSSENRAEQLGAMVRRLKAMAMDVGGVCLLVAQTNRAGRRAYDRDLDSGDLKGSGDIEDSADEVLLIKHGRRQDGQSMQPARIVVAKHRSGPVGAVDVWWDATRARFCSVHRGAEPTARRGDDPDVIEGG